MFRPSEACWDYDRTSSNTAEQRIEPDYVWTYDQVWSDDYNYDVE